MSSDPFLTTEEAVDYLQVNVRTIYRMVKRSEIPAFRVGRQWRFRKRDIEAWLAKRDAAAARGRVLVVDDESSVRDLIGKALSLEQYDVDVVDDGVTAIERLRSSPYSLLITDLKMPGMDGLEVIRAARELRPGMPVIIVTGHSSEESAIEAINLGVTGYLIKPFSMERVIAVAERVMA
jgi:excisionase family DNA binding protein